MKTAKKTLALLLALVLLIGVTPMTATATLYSAGGEGNYTSAYLDLTGFARSELTEIPIAYIASNLTDYSGEAIELEGDIVAYSKGYSSDEFVIVGSNDTVDMMDDSYYSTTYYYSSTEYYTLIVGTPDQLNRENKFYLVRVTYPEIDFSISTCDGDGNELEITRIYRDRSRLSSGIDYDYYQVSIMAKNGNVEWNNGDPIRLKFQPRTELSDRGVSVKAYLGMYETLEEIPKDAEEITDTFINGETGYLKEDAYSMDVTFVWTDGKKSIIERTEIDTFQANTSISYYPSIYQKNDNGDWNSVSDRSEYYYDSASQSIKMITSLKPGCLLDEQYCVSTHFEDYDGTINNALVTKAVIGTFASEEDAADEPDIKYQLFGSADRGEGLMWNFGTKGPLAVTAFDSYGNVLHRTFEVQISEEAPVEEEIKQNPYSSDVYFTVNGAVYSVSNDTTVYLQSYTMSYDDDAYYPSGYQTLFLLTYGGDPVGSNELKPKFTEGHGAKIYAGFEGASGVLQESGKSVVPVTYGKPIHYSAAAEDGTNLKQYYVTFVTQEEGTNLFVNAATNSEHLDEETGLPMRVVTLDETHDYHHDIFFANFGTEEMTGLKVELTDAVNIKLDDYWTIRSDSVGTLPPFDDNTKDNYGKIRIIPESSDSYGSVSGKLTISADGVEPVTILLTGSVGKPMITTDVLKSGAVKYVPYSTLIQTNYIGDETDAVVFSIIDGSLPSGVILKPNGEVYGVPLETGTFTFTVEASLKNDSESKDSKAYTLIIAENTAENVEKATDEGYELIDRIPTIITPSDQVFHSEGELSEFIAVYLDGRKLTVDSEYTLEEGSTKITILEETFGDQEEGEHTIAAEFRINGDEDGEMRTSAQNYTLEKDEEPSQGGGSGGAPRPQPTPAPESEEEKEEPEKPRVFAFIDVPADAWFYPDVKWVFERNLMNGVSETKFAPDNMVDAATIVTVLARTIGVDLRQYANNSELNLPQDQWYSAAANWATQSGLIDDSFEQNKPYSRGKMAVLLYKYFKYIGIDCTQPDPQVEFTDADQMTPQENEAFQVLYKYGIFKGVGDNRMDVRGNTSRAQLAALMHRIKEFIDSKI